MYMSRYCTCILSKFRHACNVQYIVYVNYIYYHIQCTVHCICKLYLLPSLPLFFSWASSLMGKSINLYMYMYVLINVHVQCNFSYTVHFTCKHCIHVCLHLLVLLYITIVLFIINCTVCVYCTCTSVQLCMYNVQVCVIVTWPVFYWPRPALRRWGLNTLVVSLSVILGFVFWYDLTTVSSKSLRFFVHVHVCQKNLDLLPWIFREQL